LTATLDLLTEDGLDGYISVDLGMVHAIHYYTGMVLRGITAAACRPLLSGGRYDALPASMGRDIGAVGFGISLEPLLAAVNDGDGVPSIVLVGYAPGYRSAAREQVEMLRANGCPASLHYGGRDGCAIFVDSEILE